MKDTFTVRWGNSSLVFDHNGNVIKDTGCLKGWTGIRTGVGMYTLSAPSWKGRVVVGINVIDDEEIAMFEEWYGALQDFGRNFGENVKGKSTWQESFDKGLPHTEAFYAAYPKHREIE